MYLGVDYYPEHWDEAQWEPDLLRMKEHGFNMVRVAEFAWCRLEPEDGVYRFEWLDLFLALCDRHGFDVMMGLPVRVVPAWLFRKAPEIAILSYDGTRESFGTRYTTCLSSQVLREYALRLTETMAAKYSRNKRVVAWHLDNEYGDASTCYCENCRQSFIGWLKEKYKTLENLNREWGLAFWSMELSDWDQIWLPRKTNHFQLHPSLLLEYARFTSWKTEEIIREQANILRKRTPEKLITTNIQSLTRDHTDYFKACEPLDAVSTNYYPPTLYSTVDLDVSRGIKKKNFWVVEQKSGAPGSQTNSVDTSPPGMTRLYTYQSIAHGADMILYYRWRSSYFGNEQFYMGVMGYDGGENRFSREIQSLSKELPAVATKLAGTYVKNDVALIYSPDSRWAMRDYKPNVGMDYRELFRRHYNALERHHIGMDILNPLDNLAGYKAVVLPLLYLADEKIVDNICTYVEMGGQVIATIRCASKDEFARMTQTIFPPRMAAMFGIRIPEVLALDSAEENSIRMGNASTYAIAQWAELLEADTAEVLARYTGGWYGGYAAVTRNHFGKGTATYVGTLADNRFFEHELVQLVLQAGVVPIAEGDGAIQASRRTNGTETYTFLLNTSPSKGFIRPENTGTDLLTGKEVRGEVCMQPCEVLIIYSAV